MSETISIEDLARMIQEDVVAQMATKTDLLSGLHSLRTEMTERFEQVNKRFDHIDYRFDQSDRLHTSHNERIFDIESALGLRPR